MFQKVKQSAGKRIKFLYDRSYFQKKITNTHNTHKRMIFNKNGNERWCKNSYILILKTKIHDLTNYGDAVVYGLRIQHM